MGEETTKPYPWLVEFEDGTFGVQIDEERFRDLKSPSINHWIAGNRFFGSCKGTMEQAEKVYLNSTIGNIKRIVKP